MLQCRLVAVTVGVADAAAEALHELMWWPDRKRSTWTHKLPPLLAPSLSHSLIHIAERETVWYWKQQLYRIVRTVDGCSTFIVRSVADSAVTTRVAAECDFLLRCSCVLARI